MAFTLPSSSRKYSTLRNALPFLVRQTYITNASLPFAITCVSSNRSIKSICDSQHCVLKALLLMWSSPAALENVKSSVNSTSTACQSFFSHAAYHLRMVASLVELRPVAACGLAVCGMPAAAASAYGPALSTVRRDTVVFVMMYFSRNDRAQVYDRESRACIALRHGGLKARQSGCGGRPNSTIRDSARGDRRGLRGWQRAIALK